MSEISPEFYQKYYELAKDKLVDKKDVEALQQVATTPGDREMLQDLTSHDMMSMTFESDPTGGDAHWKPKVVNFNVAANYNPGDPVPGNTPAEIVANISQSDTLDRTKSDRSRCAAAACVNAVIMDGGKAGFATLAKSLGLPTTDLTYNNVHLAQDLLYRKARGGKDGSDFQEGSARSYLNLDVRWKYDSTGKILGGSASGTMVTAAKAAGFKTDPILFENKDSSTDRKFAVESFFANNTSGSIILGVHKNDDGSVSATGGENHAVLISQVDGKYYMADTWGDNGKGNNSHQMSDDEVKQFLFTTDAQMLGLHH